MSALGFSKAKSLGAFDLGPHIDDALLELAEVRLNEDLPPELNLGHIWPGDLANLGCRVPEPRLDMVPVQLKYGPLGRPDVRLRDAHGGGGDGLDARPDSRNVWGEVPLMVRAEVLL